MSLRPDGSSGPPALSVLVIARDAAPYLPRLFASIDRLRRDALVEVVLLIDDRTTDHTARVGEIYGARVAVGRFEGFGAFKEQGRRLCRGRWILNLDADEALDADAQTSIGGLIARDEPDRAYTLAVATCLGGRRIRYGPFATEWRLRLFPRDLGHWERRDHVHERPTVSVPIERLDAVVHHHSFKDLDALKRKSGRYAQIAARRREGPPQPLKGAVRGGLRAIRYLVVHGGVVLGWKGLAVSWYTAREAYVKWTAEPHIPS